jgi:uncharacterized glyoxalase superfamily protein PhnB
VKQGEYGELDSGSTRLGFTDVAFARKQLGVDLGPVVQSGVLPPVEIGFVTEDVDTAFKRAIAAGATAVAKPARKPWGQTVSYVRDLNGLLVEICSPLP